MPPGQTRWRQAGNARGIEAGSHSVSDDYIYGRGLDDEGEIVQRQVWRIKHNTTGNAIELYQCCYSRQLALGSNENSLCLEAGMLAGEHGAARQIVPGDRLFGSKN